MLLSIYRNTKLKVFYNSYITRIACIPVSAEPFTEVNNVITRPVLVNPIQVVQQLSSSDANDFAPYIHSLPHCLNRLRDTLENNGSM